ncbi:MAG: glycerophosphodiester phosphodiesterase [Candidatus Eisenbacteria bacterium]|uniref:Glycerophosphodiester phosphodiesterase n=1 Tax=Eiseniibacteriota bacterium TaxID=2212470 RepID=A0A7Y2E6N0_UNCEI|nr:glycerophosphodiester phosphodiesterase [Candidatus Eisenbacteria bacterium]
MSDILSWIRLEGPFLLGHRGFPSQAQENTAFSFEAALESGCDGVELDARMTADGVAVVHHDAEATSGDETIVIEEQHWERLQAMSFEGEVSAYRIPRLGQVLQDLSGRCLINVEIKPTSAANRERLVRATYRETDKVRPRESVLVSSFDPEILQIMKKTDPSVLVGFLFSELKALNQLENEVIMDQLTSIHPQHELIDKKLMRRATERGLFVHAWTVDDEARAEELVKLGVTGIISNNSEMMLPYPE